MHKAVEHAVGGLEASHQVVAPPLDVEELFIACLEFLGLDIFVCKGFYHPHAQETVLHLGVYLAYLTALLPKLAAHLHIEIGCGKHHKGHHREDYQRQGHIHAA